MENQDLVWTIRPITSFLLNLATYGALAVGLASPASRKNLTWVNVIRVCPRRGAQMTVSARSGMSGPASEAAPRVEMKEVFPSPRGRPKKLYLNQNRMIRPQRSAGA